MNTPKFEILKTVSNGKIELELVVWYATSVDELDSLTLALGYKPTIDVSNRRSIFCSTPEEVDAARNPIVKFFDAKGYWK